MNWSVHEHIALTVCGALSCGMLLAHPWQVAGGSVQFDLVLSMAEEGDTLQGQLIYTTDLFTQSTAERMAGHFTVRTSS